MISLPEPDDEPPGLFRPLAEINVTPMVDVMLVLLIIFMVAAPLLVAGVKVDLPSSASAPRIERDKPVIVNILPDGAVLVENRPVARADLVGAVTASLGGALDRPVYVAGDQGAAYAGIIGVIDDLAQGGMARVVLVVEREPQAPQAGHDHAAHGTQD